MTISTKTVPEGLFFCVAEEVTQPEIPAFAERAVGPLYEALATAQLEAAGNLAFICPKWEGAGKKSRLIIALPVKEEKAAPAPHFFWKAPSFKCAWIEHTGPMPSLKAAWEDLGRKVGESGLTVHPDHGWREIYKVWESFDSENDVTELQVGLE